MRGADAGQLALAKPAEAEMGQGAILADEGDDIGNGPQCGQGGGLDEKTAEGFADAGSAQGGLADSPGELEGDAGAAEMGIGIRRSRQTGMDDGEAIGKHGRIAVPIVMVGDDQIDAALASDEGGFDGGDAAIDGDDEFGAVVDDLGQGLGIQAVSFVDAMGNVGFDFSAEEGDGVPENAGGGDAIDVVIAVDDDFFRVGDGLGDAPGGGGETGQEGRLGQGAQAGGKKALGGVESGNPPIEEHLPDERGNFQLAGQRRGPGHRRFDLPAFGSIHPGLPIGSGAETPRKRGR